MPKYVLCRMYVLESTYKAFHPGKSIVLPVLRFIQYVRATIPQYLDSISELVGGGGGGGGIALVLYPLLSRRKLKVDEVRRK